MNTAEPAPNEHTEATTAVRAMSLAKKPFIIRLLRGLAFLVVSAIPATVLTLFLGPIGLVLGVVGAVVNFTRGYKGEPLLGDGRPLPAPAPPVELAPPAAMAAATQPMVRKRRWWIIPALAIAGLLAVVIIDANLFPLHGPEKSEVVSSAKVAEAPNGHDAAPQTAAAAPAPTEDKAKDAGKYITFDQRACNGIDDCTAANIEAEQTDASRAFNRVSRTSMASAIKQLGPPTYVLRKGEVPDLPEYDGVATEGGFAEGVVGWANGKCRPNELVIRKETDRILTSPDTGGTTCTRSGSPYPLPPKQFACAGGRKSDPFCSIEGILKLPGMEERQPHPYEGDPAFNSGRHLGYLTWATDNCHGRVTGMFKAAMNLSREGSKVRFDAGVREGIAEMKRSIATSDIETACLTIRFLYGANGQNIPNAWQQ